MAVPMVENQIQDGGFRLPPQRRASSPRPRPLPASRPWHGCIRLSPLYRCPKAALQRGVPGRRPVATPAGSGCQPLRLRASFGAPRLVLRGWPPCTSYEGPASKKSPKGEVCTQDLILPLHSQQCHFPAETSDFDLSVKGYMVQSSSPRCYPVFQRRVVLLSQEMDAGLQAWQLRQQEKFQEEERKQNNALKSKGALLRNPLQHQ